MPGEPLLRLYQPSEARATLLARRLVGDVDVTPALAASIQRVFGEQLTPDEAVRRILADVRERGDAALRNWTSRIDGVVLEELAVPAEALARAYEGLAPDLRDAMQVSIDRVRAFHQKQPAGSWLEWSPAGGALGQIVRPLERVGVYAPGGRVPYPSTLIMCAIPARVAGVEEIVVATPPGPDGEPSPVILAAAYACGVERVYRVGGAQAVAALAYGTQSIPRVDKIVGPGNIFVVLAKRQVYGLVDIDGLPGPTETLVIADGQADPVLVAADLLAQAEHDTLASAILVTPSHSLAEAVQAQVARQMEELSRAGVIAESLRGQGGIVLCTDLDEAIDLANLYAAEHLCLHVADPWSLVGKVKHAGGVFLGENSYEVLGDYVAGPTHVMPTMGTARFASPLSVRDFTKIISLFALGENEARQIGAAAQRLAEAEGLTAHAAAVARRRREEESATS
ncbi:MAG: histidinol dehydrogenase [Anaerolineae bacterium]